MLFRRPFRAVWLVALGLGLELGAARANAGSEAGANKATPELACQHSQGSLATIGCRLALSLLPSAAGAEVSVVELKTDRELPAADALKQKLSESVRAALATPQESATKPASQAAGKLRLQLRLEKSAGSLRVTADLTRAIGLWQRLRKTKPKPLLHAFVEVPIDAELRALIPPPPLVVSEVLKLKLPERGIAALACGPFGPEGAQELVLVSRSHVRVGRIVGKRFDERAKVAWSALSAVAPAPLREPIATAEVTPRGRLRIGISDRKDGVELDSALGVTARFDALLPAPGGGCAARGGLGLSGKLTACGPHETAATVNLGGVMDALAGTEKWWLGRELGSDKLRLASGELSALGRVGAQLAMGDADGDGVPELAYSADVLEPGRDRLSLVSLNGAKPSRRFELAVPSISALTICAQREGPGMAPLALVTGDELWLIR